MIFLGDPARDNQFLARGGQDLGSALFGPGWRVKQYVIRWRFTVAFGEISDVATKLSVDPGIGRDFGVYRDG